jgi:hypothetical protein
MRFDRGSQSGLEKKSKRSSKFDSIKELLKPVEIGASRISQSKVSGS